jgi:hypothetical protein
MMARLGIEACSWSEGRGTTRETLRHRLARRKPCFSWLETAYDERDDSLEAIKTDPDVAPFRSDPRYADLLRQMGLPQ